MVITNTTICGNKYRTMKHEGIVLCFDHLEIDEKSQLASLWRGNEYIGSVGFQHFNAFVSAYNKTLDTPVPCSPGKGNPPQMEVSA